MPPMSPSTSPSSSLQNKSYLKDLTYTPEEESRLVRKLDLYLMSFIFLLYLASYLDRSNIGNAHTAGLTRDVHMSDYQYRWLLTIFYIAYILFQWLTIFWKLFRPRTYLFAVVIAWGTVSTCQAAAHSWNHFMALRFLLGLFEAGFGPGIPYYLSFFYLRHEIGFRIGIFLVAPSLAAAFAGALAYGITKHADSIAIAPWRLLFLVEGLPTIVLGVLTIWCLPDSAATARGLTPRQRDIAAARTLAQTGAANRAAASAASPLALRIALRALLDPKNLACAAMYFCVNVAFAALPIYLPTILQGMNHSAATAQGLTAPPYLAAAAATLACTRLSDRTRQRGLPAAALFGLAAAGYIMLATIPARHTSARYAATFLCCAGVFPGVAVLVAWIGDMHGDDARRATGYIIVQAAGQTGPLLGARLYPASEGPRFAKGFWTTAGCLLGAAAVALALRGYLQWCNRQRDKRAQLDTGSQELRASAGDLQEYELVEGGTEREDNVKFRYIL